MMHYKCGDYKSFERRCQKDTNITKREAKSLKQRGNNEDFN